MWQQIQIERVLVDDDGEWRIHLTDGRVLVGLVASPAWQSFEEQKNTAYRERNRLVAALSKLFPSVRGRTSIDGWDPEWQNCVRVELPTGQTTWHYHDSEAHLFDHLQTVLDLEWDGHDTPEKYRRLDALEPAWKIEELQP